MKTAASQAIGTLGVALGTILVLLGAGVALFLNPFWVAFEQGRANAAGWTGFSAADLRAATDAILRDLYLGGRFDVTVGFILIAILLGQTVLIALPDTFLWQSVGLSFPLGIGAGLPGLLIGWLVGWIVGRRMRATAPQPAGSPAS